MDLEEARPQTSNTMFKDPSLLASAMSFGQQVAHLAQWDINPVDGR